MVSLGRRGGDWPIKPAAGAGRVAGEKEQQAEEAE